RHWKWRMHGAAVELARQFLDQPEQPDLILTTDMLDTATFLALTRSRTATIPTAVYFHENQLTYPWSPTDEDVTQKRDRHYAWINYTSALAADAVFFNSQYHHDSFLGALPGFLKAFPDHKGLGTVAQIADKSSVLYLGMDLRAFDPIEARYNSDIPVLLWNHRWEYDKDPETFFACCEQLHDEGVDFRLIVLGESYANRPAVFDAVKEKLSAKTLHWGYAEGFAEYASLVKSAHILPVTSRQDFFGGSVVEAMYCGVYPLLPDRLAFGEHVVGDCKENHIYSDHSALLRRLRSLLKDSSLGPSSPELVSQFVSRYDWRMQVVDYDQIFKELLS
ncbi:MAG: DUF3524 domain-containing protein, partial [Bacteroidota bacterium]